jgi:hypothetical protein
VSMQILRTAEGWRHVILAEELPARLHARKAIWSEPGPYGLNSSC